MLTVGLCSIVFESAHGASDPDIRFLEERVKADDLDFIAWNRLGMLCLKHLRDTGNDQWLIRAGEAANASLKAVGGELNALGLALRARVDLAEHRFPAARAAGQQLRELQSEKSGALSILADALLELGDLGEAAKVLEDLAQRDGSSIIVESRRARLNLLQGQLEEAREHFIAARDAARALAPASPINVAWCELQLGEVAFRAGRWDEADVCYQAALAAVPDWWSALEHLAELRGAQARNDEALDFYDRAIAQTPRPEILQAVGDFYLFLRRDVEAHPWLERARDGYLASVQQGRVLYIHHLAGFYTDSQENPAEAVKWAKRDLELRQSVFAWDALAWALHKHGDYAEARDAAKKALATGISDAHVLYHSAMVHISAGDIAAGQALLKRCAEINPRFNTFHSHR